MINQPKQYIQRLSKALLGQKYDELSEEEQLVITSIASRNSIVTNANDSFNENLTFGQRLADKIASLGGSWSFILIFLVTLISWMVFNTIVLKKTEVFDPYPFILLNLVLSTIAAIQAPIILMSQKRQAAKDRHDSEVSFNITLKSELEIARLHQKINVIMNEMKIDDPNKGG